MTSPLYLEDIHSAVSGADPVHTKRNRWIAWGGGDCPVPAGTEIEYHMRSGKTMKCSDPEALHWDRKFPDADYNILHYRVVSAPASLTVEQAWRPIESAPKDGKTMLLGYFNSHNRWRTMRGRWFSAEHIAEQWEEPDDVDEGWFETAVEPDDMPNCWRTNPTHWMPLPAPPSPVVIAALVSEKT